MDLPERSVARLQGLKEKTEAVSYAEVLKNALRLYESLIDEDEAGNVFFVRTPTGETKQYVIF